MVKCTGRALVVKRPGVLSEVQMLNLVLGVGVFSLRSSKILSFGALESGSYSGLAPATANASEFGLFGPHLNPGVRLSCLGPLFFPKDSLVLKRRTRVRGSTPGTTGFLLGGAQ